MSRKRIVVAAALAALCASVPAGSVADDKSVAAGTSTKEAR